jgi:predicted small lipoprotein YifL
VLHSIASVVLLRSLGVRLICVLLFAAMLFAACGQKGPLHLPKDDEKQQKK